MDTHMVVDSRTGLKIVRCNSKNFYSSKYAVQFVGSELQCKREMQRLKALEKEFGELK